MHEVLVAFGHKLATLSSGLRAKLHSGKRNYKPRPSSPVSNHLVHNMRHCNAGSLVDAGLWLRDFCNRGNKLFLAIAGAFSSFEGGVPLSQLIMAGKVGAISSTGANLEESLYRLLAQSCYVYIPHYEKLSGEEEDELGMKGFRRITTTLLPEHETIHQVLPLFEMLWREEAAAGRRHAWTWYFFELFRRELIVPDPAAKLEECWLYQAFLHNVPVFAPGCADSTLGNIFSQYIYNRPDKPLGKYQQEKPINPDIVYSDFVVMNDLADLYVEETKDKQWGFLQLGGGIAGDFAICVVPHLMDDFHDGKTERMKRRLIRCWGAFVELFVTPQSVGSYAGAGFWEKITWKKVRLDGFGAQVFGDFLINFPLIASIILEE